MSEPTVAVVGLGPVGATAALLLARAGVRVAAIERDPVVYPHPRAVALDDEALRVLQAAGVAPGRDFALRSGGMVRFRGRSGASLVELPPPPEPYGHPGLGFFHQPELEALLRSRLGAHPRVDVHTGVSVTGAREEPGGVRLSLADAATGERRDLRIAYVIACDGARSTLRRALGIRLRGVSAGRDWLVAETTAPGSAPTFVAQDFEFSCDPRRPWVHGPLPHGVHRWEFMLARGERATDLERPETVLALLDARSPGRLDVLRAAVYTFHARVASRWRAGRILLAGDAAHLAPPFAGQGLGAGLRDAHNLAWKVAAVLDGRAAPGLLDSYESERRPHVVRMTALATALGAVVQARPGPAAARDAGFGTAFRSRRIRAWLARGGWKPPAALGPGLRAAPPHTHRAGRLLPQPRVAAADPGPPVPLDDRLGPGFALVAASGDPGTALGPAARRTAAELGVRLVPGAGELAAWLAPAELALVRPDRFVFGTARDDATRLLDDLLGTLGTRL